MKRLMSIEVSPFLAREVLTIVLLNTQWMTRAGDLPKWQQLIIKVAAAPTISTRGRVATSCQEDQNSRDLSGV